MFDRIEISDEKLTKLKKEIVDEVCKTLKDYFGSQVTVNAVTAGVVKNTEFMVGVAQKLNELQLGSYRR